MYKIINILLKAIPKDLKSKLKKNDFIKKTFVNLTNKNYSPDWQKINQGPLKDRFIFLDKNTGLKSMVEGDHDMDQIQFINNKLDLKSKTIFDIGAHIGYMSMCFATIVGEQGKVISFEPNPYNLDRFKKNLEKNEDLSKIIDIRNVAVTNSNGSEKFVFSKNVDSGTSSGGFLDRSDTALNRKFYELFEETETETVNLSDFTNPKPDLIKIDIEGFEGNLIKTNQEYLTKFKPTLIIEIHSIENMFDVLEGLKHIGYDSEIIKKEDDGRCTIFCSVKTDEKIS
jgi:FkbM family methyltransferase